MGAVVFENAIFDSWLTKKSDEILEKVDKQTISTEEMLILVLKAQTNHFHHMDMAFREEFKSVREEFKLVREEFKSIRQEIRSFQMWLVGILLVLFSGIYFKLFFG